MSDGVSRELSAARAAKKSANSTLPSLTHTPTASPSPRSMQSRGGPRSFDPSATDRERERSYSPVQLRETLLLVPPGRKLSIQLKKKERRLREELEKVRAFWRLLSHPVDPLTIGGAQVQRAEADAQKAFAEHVRNKYGGVLVMWPCGGRGARLAAAGLLARGWPAQGAA